MITTANDVLVDLLEDTRRRMKRFMEGLPEGSLYWSPDGEANNIAVTVWHMGRLLDVFLVRMILGQAAEDECWQRDGWSEKTGYDPRGIGRDGWGAVNDYTLDEVAAIPPMSAEILLGYLDDIYDRAHAYIENTPIEDLHTSAVGFEGRLTRYNVIQMALVDNIRHMGEIYAIKAMWLRQHPPMNA